MPSSGLGSRYVCVRVSMAKEEETDPTVPDGRRKIDATVCGRDHFVSPTPTYSHPPRLHQHLQQRRHQQGPALPILLASAEIIRRGLWCLLRLEAAHLAAYRPVSSSSEKRRRTEGEEEGVEMREGLLGQGEEEEELPMVDTIEVCLYVCLLGGEGMGFFSDCAYLLDTRGRVVRSVETTPVPFLDNKLHLKTNDGLITNPRINCI